MSCERCGGECPYCDDSQEAWEKQRAKELQEWCESHNLNSTPAEVAIDIKQSSYDPDECYDAMKAFGLPESQIETVRDAYEVFC
jgi:hypothetical protein